MSIRDDVLDLQSEHGWTDKTLLDLLVRYVDDLGHEDVLDYLVEASEIEEDDFLGAEEVSGDEEEYEE